METQSFENYQRILDNSSNKQITIMGLVLAFQAAGYAGVYQVLSTPTQLNTVAVMRALAVIMVIITSILLFVWSREHHLAEQCVADLKKANVQFPENDCWTGRTGSVWKVVHWGSIVVWTILIIFAGCIQIYFKT